MQKLSSLKGVVPGLPISCYSADPEGCTYASSIRDALRANGLDEGLMVGILFAAPIDSRLYVVVKDRDHIPPAYWPVVNALKQAGLDPSGLVDANSREGEISFRVGRN
jgi:hypothetical protein